MHDKGTITLKGKEYTVLDVTKVGKCVMHHVSPCLEGGSKDYIGVEAECEIDEVRRTQLRCHHTATHIMYSAAR